MPDRWWLWPAGLALTAAGCVPPASFRPISPQGQEITALFLQALALSLLVFLLVASALAYAVVRFRARPGDEEPRQVRGNRALEIAWTSAALLVVAFLFLRAVQTMATVRAAEPAALRVRVIGHQWWWEYQYPEQGIVTANELRVPVDTPLRLEIESADVVHSFWVPQFGWKQDAIPGRTIVMGVRAGQAGQYDGACAEYCGLQHAWMRTRVVVEPREQFEAWVRQQQEPVAAPPDAAAATGQQVFLQNTCVSCHTIQGTMANARVGPDLSRFGSRATIGAGVLDNTPENLRRWIRNPHELKPGVLMPGFQQLPEDDLNALVAYLEGLR